ncbi:hypothetical protein POPTR_002G220667v4 [Populus trichocarpa]|uniref:Uncharacterized protein n=1 Tax=Populus trichocarpa TaxID=3694 RepID=A0ACC0TGJ3_POPTR|nr:hypothetical protein BDE02_02G194800 [Populus trichocarpa]KAI9400266.1 hypothetical protein POPTR_002G220667v4 [Populus trichocarpa]
MTSFSNSNHTIDRLPRTIIPLEATVISTAKDTNTNLLQPPAGPLHTNKPITTPLFHYKPQNRPTLSFASSLFVRAAVSHQELLYNHQTHLPLPQHRSVVLKTSRER